MPDAQDIDRRFAPFERMMREAHCEPLVIEAFRRHYTQLLRGETGLISERDIEPAASTTGYDSIVPHAAKGLEELRRVVIIKLNGGLGTSMGLERAKSLIEVRDGLSFLDIIARQVRWLKQEYGIPVPLVFMNSATTRDATGRAMAAYPDVATELPADFLQHRVPKVLAEDYTPPPVTGDADNAWCPPGHGDLYAALLTSGLLDRMLDAGYTCAFVSNADNLGAVLDTAILGYFAASGTDFLMEVADRTAVDRKGGHLALRGDGRLALREFAQCPDEEREAFQDIARHRFFNTNNLWLHLPSVRALLEEHGGLLPLPLIRNGKTLDPRDPATPRVYQLETAMGAAISLFPRAAALRVPRARFAPVKTTDDLIAVRSDACVLTGGSQVVPNPARKLPTLHVSLDPAHYRTLDQLRERFPSGPPSLVECASLTVEGDCVFGRNVTVRGTVRIAAEPGRTRIIPDDAVIEG